MPTTNPLYGIAASGYGSYAAGKAGNWREAFKQGTIATVLTILAVVTAGKGLKSLVKKGGAAGLGAAENRGGKLGGPGIRTTAHKYTPMPTKSSCLRLRA